ncbi:MAG: anhydro-N-acetylmuramic acid kinase [Salegentibacter sp.]|uniref:Anhydro-N-acetylmuramic acid kinase n=1 Tax=Salegentibacter flavus TaxID=287099 RepID=A0A1I5AIP7_9FLAO|nr:MULTISPECIES: anhydro-N-acetylmuramic acid kinase [Salegentibacter]MDR9457039.1 anhydro-N-acetylmuramic acid kinase [Salegentibacter sp.]SFN62315.1 anhydro-N-acetylmuramic acid kinase [Salegentibacter flavus]
MKKANYKVLGVMSGTSLDGIDLVYVNFDYKNEWSYKILRAETSPYPLNWQETLAAAINFSEESLEDLNLKYTRYLAGVISQFIEKHHITDLDAICSHGHTIKHEPENRYTLQIGNLQQLAYLTGQKVVCDFRVQDVKLGGQGAPLVPIGDRLLFSDYKYCLNLGGFANISTEENGERIAYDICAVNTVLNHYAKKLGKEFDEGGKLAAAGELNKKLLKELNQLPFYAQNPPKSLGMEWVSEEVFPVLEKYEDDIPAILHTCSVHIAQQIANVLDNDKNSNVLVTGGGAFNNFIIKELKAHSQCHFTIPSKEIIDFKEALIFGLLGVLKIRGEVNTLKTVTGAEKDHSAGVIFEL